MTILYMALGAVPLFLLWAFIHEEAHVFINKALRPDGTFKRKYYPHKIHGKRLVFAAYYGNFQGILTDEERAQVAFAPAFCDMVAIVLMHLAYWTMADGLFKSIFIYICLGAVIDLIVGSIGKHPQSDLRRVEKNGVDIVMLRALYCGFILVGLYPVLATFVL